MSMTVYSFDCVLSNKNKQARLIIKKKAFLASVKAFNKISKLALWQYFFIFASNKDLSQRFEVGSAQSEQSYGPERISKLPLNRKIKSSVQKLIRRSAEPSFIHRRENWKMIQKQEKYFGWWTRLGLFLSWMLSSFNALSIGLEPEESIQARGLNPSSSKMFFSLQVLCCRKKLSTSQSKIAFCQRTYIEKNYLSCNTWAENWLK